MKIKLSRLAIIIVMLLYSVTSFLHFSHHKPPRVTTWDALGYYLYLPATFIYHDLDRLSFYPEIEKKYSLQGKENEFYQFSKLPNGNYTGKYFTGIAILQSPFFLLAHGYCVLTNHFHADGFSSPYQLSIILAALFYCGLGLWLLRINLSRYYSENIVAASLIIIGLATNLIQYAAVDVGQSHVYLFFLYALIIYLTGLWHDNHTNLLALLIGGCIGLATLCRPTEIIMFFIPLLWYVGDKEKWKLKLAALFSDRKQFIFTSLGFLIFIGVQLVYWQFTTGSFIYDVGSKWHFLNPHWRVLFGFEKGWFIYTPITILFAVGLVLIKKDSPFKKAIITFSLLNIWIVIAWADWRYGGSYSTRALVQSYPVWAFAFAACLQWIANTKLKSFFYALSIYLICVNLFQVYQYNTGILHYDKMNFDYYKRIYLNPKVTEEDKKLLSP